MANQKDLANGLIGTALTSSATTLVLQAGYEDSMPAVPFFLTLTPTGQLSTRGNSEIVRVTAITGDTLTIERAQKGTTARAFSIGDIVSNSIYAEGSFDSLDVAGDIYSNGKKLTPFVDGIIEYKVTSTYSYYKYASGRCVQTIIRTYTGAVSTLWNGMRITDSISSVSLPVALSSVTSVHTGVNSPTYNVWLMAGGATTTTETGNIYIISPENITSSRTYKIYTTVEGILP